MAFVPGELVIITLIERKGRFWGGNNRLPRIIQLLCFQQIGELVIVTLIKHKGSFWEATCYLEILQLLRFNQ